MTTLAAKLRIGPGSRIRLIDAPGAGAELLGPLPAGATIASADEPADVTILISPDEATLRRDLPSAAKSAAGDRLLWVAYPKGGARAGTDLDRDRLTALSDEIAGLTGVSLIAVDATWSAIRLRPSERYRA